MKSLLCLALITGASAAAADGNVMGKIFGMMDDMKSKIIHDGEAEQKAYEEYFEWCDDASKNKQFEIKTLNAKVEDLTSVIEKANGDEEAASSRVEELGGSISQAESDLKGATDVRKHEKEEFKAAELDMVDTVDKLSKAEGMLNKMAHGSSFAQTDAVQMKNMIKSLGDLMQAATLDQQDRKQLTALVQASQNSDDETFSAPAADAYSSHTGAILDLIVDMKEKAEAELDELRSKEKEAENNFQMLKLSLEDQMDADKHEMSEQKQAKAEASGSKAQAEGDLSATQKSLDQANKALEDMRQGCMQTAADHEETVKARKEELAVLAKARGILEESVGGAVKQSYGFIQLNSHSDLVKSEVVTMVRALARKHHSSALAQLASRVAAVVKYSNGQDPFGKVKGLITDLVAKLEKEAQEEATEKAYCDEQMGKTGAKKEELDNTFSKLTAKVDKAAAASAELKEEVKGLQADLASLAKTQAEMDKIRAEEKAAYTEASTDLKLGLEGVRKALTVLRDYYGSSAAAMVQTEDFNAFMRQPAPPAKHSSSSDAGGSIINMLEVAESDFAKDLAEEEKTESDAVEEYETTTEDNKMAKMTQEQDVKYKTAEFKGLDKQIAEVSGDRSTVTSELSAVNEYFAKIKERCVAKPESYEERKARREAEITGLKEALETLNNEAAFVQRKKHHLRAGVIAM